MQDTNRIKKEAREAVMKRFAKWQINKTNIDQLSVLFLDGVQVGLEEAKRIYNQS